MQMNPRNPLRIGSSPNLPKVGRTIIIDPRTKDTYLLYKEIGSSSDGFCRIYRALYSKRMKNGILVPCGNVTLKTVNQKLHHNESIELQLQVYTKFTNPHGNLIGLNNSFTTDELLCVSLTYMSEGSLRYILSTRRPNNKLPEDCIAAVLKEALVALQYVHVNGRVHGTFNAGDIFVHMKCGILIKLAFEASLYDSENVITEEDPNEEDSLSSSFLDVKSISKWGAAPEAFGRDSSTCGPKSDIWLFGITALELAYGNLPVQNREDLVRIIKKIREEKRLPRSLDELLKKKGIFKKASDLFKRKEKVFSDQFERMILNCLSENPKKRPTAEQLLDTPFFKTYRNMKKFEQFLFNGKNPEKRAN